MLIYSLSSSCSPEIVRYIGYTQKPLNKRLIEHLSESRYKRTHKDKWIQKELKIGNEIIAKEIDRASEIYDLKKREIGYIFLLKSMGAKLVNGTNGGDGVVGLVHTEKFKDWNRLTKSKVIYCFNYETKELIRTFPSMRQMCEDLKLTTSQVGYVLSGYRNYHKGYTFSYKPECPISKPRKQTPVWNKGKSNKGFQGFKITPVIAFNSDKEFSFPTVNSACAFFGIKFHSQICRAIKNETMYKGYWFKRA